jgi:RHS repeat-associated protein
MRRFYLSKFAPSGGAPAYRTALGPRWGHTYATWIDDVSGGGPTKVMLHTTRGADVLLSKTSNDATWDYFTPQPGYHYKSFKRRRVSPFDYEITTLTGESFTYNGSGRLTGIRDTLLNTVALSYHGDGQLKDVLDASAKRRLLFSYSAGVMTTIEFQIFNGSWSTYHTTTYGYTSGNLTSVTIGGQLAQTNVYTTNYLTAIQDGGGNTLVAFAYDGAVAGKVVRVDTPRGVVGYEFAPSRANCSGANKTVLYFHKQNTTSCSVDADCGTGYLCGGKTGAGATGQCFRGARCLTTKADNEDLVTTVSAFAGNSETCSGACLDAIEYIWNTAGGALDLTAVKSPPLPPPPDESYSFTVKEYNANGLPTRIAYGSPDATGTTKEREEWFEYEPNFPGRVRYRKHLSEAPPAGSVCTNTNATGCALEFFGWNANGTLNEVMRYGRTLNASGSSVAVAFSTLMFYDAQGRLTESKLSTGANRVVYEYWSSSNPLFDGFLKNVTRHTNPIAFLVQSSQDFDFWGNATRIVDADGTISCQSFDPARGYLTQRREQMAGQTDCTPNSADLVTSYLRDSALRLTQLTRPDGSCMVYEYDTRGRLSKTKRRDDCNALSGGDREEYTYSVEGLLTKVETFDAANTITKRQELTYFDSRRLEKILNPVNTAKWTGLAYEDRGLVASVTAVDGANDLSKTEWTYNKDARVLTEKRHYASSGTTPFDTWNLLFSWIGLQKYVKDGDNKETTSTRDDFGNIVWLASPDLGGFPTLRVFDSSNRLATVKETFGGAGVRTHAFTYDSAGRPLNSDYHGTCTGWNVPDIMNAYDCLGSAGGCTTGAPACPIGTSCTNLAGRLAYVKVKLMCTTAAGPDGDYTLEQETWYGYDAAGRLTHEYVKDDTGRTAAHVYEWTKNGALQKVTLPSTAAIGWTYGSGTSNSDTDRIVDMWRGTTATPVATAATYYPYGPLYRYNHANVCGTGPGHRTTITRNLAYRVTQTRVDRQNSTGTQHQVTITEDAKGRVTRRDYWPQDPSIPGLFDSWFKYDLQDRVLCETTNSVSSCPTSGANIKNSHTASPPFMAAGDWKQLKRPIPGSTGQNHDFTLFSGTHQISTVTQTDGTPALGPTAIRYDSRGNRNLDDNQAASPLTNDERTYVYDERRNLANVRGQYFTSGSWRYYNVTSTFDAKNRRVSKSFHDETSGKVATWFFYYDPLDRLSEVRYTPDTATPATYQVFQLFWLGDRLVAYWQTDYPTVTTSKRYVGTDETGRPIDMINWPASGNCTRVWSVNPDAWGFDRNLIGSSLFQPVLFEGQYKDDETAAWQNDGVTRHRPGLVLNWFRSYDPWTGSYLQVDPLVDQTWSSYQYVNGNPVGFRDRSGLRPPRIKLGFKLGQLEPVDSCYDTADTEIMSDCLAQCGPFQQWSTCGCIPIGSTCWGDGWVPINCGQVRGDGWWQCPGPNCCSLAEEFCNQHYPLNCPPSQPACENSFTCKMKLKWNEGQIGYACSSICFELAYSGISSPLDCYNCLPPVLPGSPFTVNGTISPLNIRTH